jgi:hypothetical protein
MPGSSPGITRWLHRASRGSKPAVAQNDPPRCRQRSARLRHELGQSARDRLDGGAEIIGDVLVRYQHLDLLDGGKPLGQAEQEPMGRALARKIARGSKIACGSMFDRAHR